MRPLNRTRTLGGAGCLILLCLCCAPPTVAAPLPADLVNEALATALENLNRSIEQRDRAADALAGLKASGQASPEVLADYENYLLLLERMVEENRLTVQRLSSLQAAPAEAGSGAEAGGVADDPVQALDRELDDSLAAFDAMLLKELEKIRTASAGRMRDLSDQAASAVQRLKEKGIDLEAEGGMRGESKSGTEPSGDKTGDGEPGQDGRQSPDRQGGTENGETSTPGEKRGDGQRAETDDAAQDGQGGTSGRQERYSGGRDDDIVARQLREAAEKETDPALREKLWKEYEAYKKSQQ